MGMDGAYVLPDYADKKQLHRAEKKQSDHQGRNAYRETVPKDQLINKVSKGYNQTKKRHSKTDHRGQPQGNFGMLRDTKHGHIVERV
jgi:hypothetical protein